MRNPSFPPFRVGLFFVCVFPILSDDSASMVSFLHRRVQDVIGTRVCNALLLPRVRLHFFHARVRRELVICVWLPVTKLIPSFFFSVHPVVFIWRASRTTQWPKRYTHTHTRKKEKTFFRVGRVSRVKRRRRRLKTGLGAEDLFCLRVFEKKRKKPTRIFSRVAHPWNCVHKNVRPISSFLKPFSIMTLVPDSFFFSVCPFFFLLCLFCLFSWALILGSFSLMVSSS